MIELKGEYTHRSRKIIQDVIDLVMRKYMKGIPSSFPPWHALLAAYGARLLFKKPLNWPTY